MQLEHLDPNTLKPHPQNSRKHSEEQLMQLMQSIERFGFNGAVIIDEDDVILVGHGRTQAMIRLGRATIPCMRKTGLTDLEKRAYVIADNQIALNSEWDDDVLAAEIATLLDGGLDLSDLGIPVDALAELEQAPPATASSVRALEARADTAGLLPIVPMYAEHHEAFVIVCDNTIDEAWLRNRLGLEQPMQSYKDRKGARTNVITVQQFRQRIQ